MRSRLTALLKLFYNPHQAMIEIGAVAPYLTGAALALLSTFFYYEALSRERGVIATALGEMERVQGVSGPYVYLLAKVFSGVISSVGPVAFVAVIFVPACLLAASLLDHRASFRRLLQEEYAPLAACVLYAWAGAHLIMLIPALFLFDPSAAANGPVVAVLIQAGRMRRPSPASAAYDTLINTLRLVPLPYFIFLVTVALRAILRLSVGRALGVVVLGACSLLAIPLLPRFLFILTSPFLLIILIVILRNVFGDVLGAQAARESFKQNLENATLNPADASAHYNLGLIYQKRGQIEEAKASFRRAVEIHPDETDAHYQLGRIAREENRLADAITHFDAVVRQNPDHSQSEVWREIGHTYFQAGQYQDALPALERFLDRRPSDAEGRYQYGLTLHHLGRAGEAAEQMHACIEAVRTAPAYKYRAEKRWMDEARAFLNSQAAGNQ